MKIKKIIVCGLIIIIILTSGFVVYKKISNNDNNNNLKLPEKVVVDESSDGKKTTAVVVSDNRLIEKSLKSSLSGKLIVLESTIDVEHKTSFIENFPVTAILPGFTNGVVTAKAEVSKVGRATIVYDYYTDLNKAEMNIEGNTINIILDKPKLNERTVKIKDGSFKADSTHSNISFFGRIKIAAEALGADKETIDGKAGKKLMEEIPIEAKKKIKENENQEELNKKAIESFQVIIDNTMKDKNTDYSINISVKE